MKKDAIPKAEVNVTEDQQTTTDECKDDNVDTEKITCDEEVKEQGTKRPVEDVGPTEEVIAAKKLKTVESSDQEVPAKKVSCEE